MPKFADAQKDDLTPQQRDAAGQTNSSVAMIAGAGSGKTRTMIARTLNIIGKNWDMLDRMLVITFTEKAASELKQRLCQKMPDAELARLSSAWIGTFHWFAARVLRAHAPLLGLDPEFRICDENTSKIRNRRVVTEILTRFSDEGNSDVIWLIEELEFKNVRSLLEEMLSFRWQAKKFLENDDPIYNRLRTLFKICLDTLESETNLMQAVDFQQIEIKLLDLFSRHQDMLKDLQKRFTHVLVDEYQDTSDIQSEIVRMISENKNTKLCIVGDPNQSIYRFRGANRRSFDNGIKNILSKGGKTFSLEENFRSSPEIIDYINRLFEKIGGNQNQFGFKMKPVKSSSGISPLVSIKIDLPEGAKSEKMRASEAEAIAQYIKGLIENGISASKIACLFKAMTQSSIYEAAFKRHGIPYQAHGGYGFLEKQEVCDIISALKFADNSEDYVSMIGLLRSPMIGMSDEEILRFAGKEGKELRNNLRSSMAEPLLSFLENESRYLLPSEIIAGAAEITEYSSVLDQIDPAFGMSSNLERMIDLARNEEEETLITLGEFVSSIDELKKRGAKISEPSTTDITEEYVRCMTVHAAKGLQFPIVILPDLFHQRSSSKDPWRFSPEYGISIKKRNPKLPWKDRLEDDHFTNLKESDENEIILEEKRLLYVAMTRAQDQLVVVTHSNLKNGTDKTWHDWIAPTVGEFKKWKIPHAIRKYINVGVDPCVDPLKRADTGGSPYKKTKHLTPSNHSFTVSHLETYDRCPYEYYLKYVQIVPSFDPLSKANKFNSLIKGIVTHAVLAATDKKNLEELVIRESQRIGIVECHDDCKRLAKKIAHWLETERGKTIDCGWHELNFDWMHGQNIISGTIDWIKFENGQIEIYDFKTSDADFDHYDLQLATYAIAAQEALNAQVSKTALISIESGNEISRDFDKKRKERTIIKIDAIIKGIKERSFEPSPEKKKCFRCYYRKQGICLSSRSPSQPVPVAPCS